MLVITNLVSNAVKFSHENDTVEVAARVFNKDFLEFIVKDEGAGIPEANKEKIFHIGKIFSTEGTKGEKGTGLGLALAKQIVEKHGGEIWFYSDEGVGSEFHFTVPSSTSTILIVTQSNDERKELQKILNEQYSAFNILTAENGFEALGIISAKMPSLIISSHDLPMMDGIQFAHTVRKEYKNLRIPFIALLGSDSEAVKKMYQEIGIKTLNNKPIDLSQLNEKIQSLLW
jgi:CheY-like chemotaxis protein